MKGHGFYYFLNSDAHPTRLSLIYEIIPIAFLIEKAGGKACDEKGNNVLDIKIEALD